jgi:hypothetical protein
LLKKKGIMERWRTMMGKAWKIDGNFKVCAKNLL